LLKSRSCKRRSSSPCSFLWSWSSSPVACGRPHPLSDPQAARTHCEDLYNGMVRSCSLVFDSPTSFGGDVIRAKSWRAAKAAAPMTITCTAHAHSPPQGSSPSELFSIYSRRPAVMSPIRPAPVATG
jgi:hypothetical protein